MAREFRAALCSDPDPATGLSNTTVGNQLDRGCREFLYDWQPDLHWLE